jgi:3-dehydroquinate dehydratase-2
MAKLLLLNGPNLNMLGRREPGHYGRQSLDAITDALVREAEARGHTLCCFQSNAEHALIDRIHAAKPDGVDFILINPAAFTHTSVALRDALLASPFRSSSSTSAMCMHASRSASTPTYLTSPSA